MATSTVQLGTESASQNRPHAVWAFFREELKPSPGRYALLFRLVASVLLALWIDMAFGLKDIGIGLYIPFFLIQGSVKKNFVTLLMLVGTCALAALYMLFVMDVLSGSPPVRFVAATLITFVGVYLIKAAQISQPWLVLSLAGAGFVRSWDSGGAAASIGSGSLSLVLTMVIGASSAVFVQYIISLKRPLQQLQDSLAAPLAAVIETLGAHTDQRSPKEGQKQLQKLALQGGEASKALLADAGKRNDRVQLVHARLSGTIETLVVLVDQTLYFSMLGSEDASAADEEALRTIQAQLRDLQDVIRKGKPPAVFSYPPHEQISEPVTALAGTVETLAAVLHGDRVLPEGHAEKAKGGFLKPGALKEKDNLISAFKTTLAATLCYGIYTGVDWSQISASVTTCIITTEDSLGMERQKQVLRLIGDSLAGICAIGAICFLLPHFTSIAGVTVIVAVMTLVGGYVYLGSYKLSYAGRQLSYCFFLATLTGTSTPNSLTEARDRVVAVMLGVCMMWLISDQVKPVRTSTKMREGVVGALGALEKICSLRNASCSAEDKLKELIKIRSSFGKALQLLQMNTELRAFEVTMTQTGHKRRLPVIQQITHLLLQVFLRNTTAVEGDILDLETAKQRECSPEESMRKLGDLSKTLSSQPKSPPSNKPTVDDALLDQVRSALQEALAV